VSKYYRKLCEERLYADIELEGSSPRPIISLLITLVTRKDVVPLIQNLRVIQHPKEDQSSTPTSAHSARALRNFATNFRQHKDAVKLAIHDVFARLPNEDKPDRAGMEEYLLKAVFETPMTGDGALAIMICMATNLNSLRIDLARSSPLPVTQSMLSPLGWSDHSDSKAYPFHRLKSLYLGSSPGDETYCNVAIHSKCSELTVSGITLVEKLSWSKYDNPNQL
jgi:hypothetical protein